MRHHVLALGVGLALFGPAVGAQEPTSESLAIWEREGIAHLPRMLAQARRDGTRLLVGLAGSPG